MNVNPARHDKCEEIRKAVQAHLDELDRETQRKFNISLKEEVQSDMDDGFPTEDQFDFVITDSFFFIALVTEEEIAKYEIGSEDNELIVRLADRFVMIMAL